MRAETRAWIEYQLRCLFRERGDQGLTTADILNRLGEIAGDNPIFPRRCRHGFVERVLIERGMIAVWVPRRKKILIKEIG